MMTIGVVLVTVLTLLGVAYGAYLEFRPSKKKLEAPDDVTATTTLMLYDLPAISAPLRKIDIRDLKQVWAEYIQSNDWRRALSSLGKLLPELVAEQALSSTRTANEITDDYFKLVLEPLIYDFKNLQEVREAQSKVSFKLGWIASYPFIDLADEKDGGLYETTRGNLLKGVQYVFFQPEDRFFRLLRQKLLVDPTFTNKEVLDENSSQCKLWCVTPYDTPVEFALYNPGGEEMEGAINVGESIQLKKVGERWISEPGFLMKGIVSKQKLYELHEKRLKPVYEKYFEGKNNSPQSVSLLA